MTGHRLKVFGWGRENEAMTPDEEAFALRTYQTLFGVSTFETVPVPTLDTLALRRPRLTPPTPLAGHLHCRSPRSPVACSAVRRSVVSQRPAVPRVSLRALAFRAVDHAG